MKVFLCSILIAVILCTCVMLTGCQPNKATVSEDAMMCLNFEFVASSNGNLNGKGVSFVRDNTTNLMYVVVSGYQYSTMSPLYRTSTEIYTKEYYI